jgi:hypothetical protein
MKCTKLSLIFLFLSVLLSVGACRKKAAPPPVVGSESGGDVNSGTVEPAAGAEQAKSQGLENALAQWSKGEKEQAVEVFLAIAWEQPLHFSPDSVWLLSEKDFAAMPESKRTEMQQQAMDVAQTTKELARYVTGLGQADLAKKDFAAAERCFRAVSGCGKAVSKLDALMLLKMVGNAIQRLGDKELAALGEQAPSAPK